MPRRIDLVNRFCSIFSIPIAPVRASTFNHLRTLHRQFHADVAFVAALEGTDPERLRRRYAALNLPIPAFVDADQSIARSVGVYATPQAVILDRWQRLVYRGNYNISRYCTARQTEFARLALESLLHDPAQPVRMPTVATTAYGCSLPPCSRKGEAQ